MSKRKLLRGVSLIMLAIAVVFVAVAVQNPQLGTAIQVGSLYIGASVWRVFYGVYLLAAVGLLGASFAVKP